MNYILFMYLIVATTIPITIHSGATQPPRQEILTSTNKANSIKKNKKKGIYYLSTEEEFNTLLATHDVVFVDFYRDTCPPCTKLSGILEKLAVDFPTVLFLKIDSRAFSTIA